MKVSQRKINKYIQHLSFKISKQNINKPKLNILQGQRIHILLHPYSALLLTDSLPVLSEGRTDPANETRDWLLPRNPSTHLPIKFNLLEFHPSNWPSTNPSTHLPIKFNLLEFHPSNWPSTNPSTHLPINFNLLEFHPSNWPSTNPSTHLPSTSIF